MMNEVMNQQTFTAIWNNALKLLQEDLTEPAFRTWIAPLELVAYVEGQVYLKARNTIERNVVEGQYRAVIKNTLKMVFGYDIELIIVTVEEWCRMQNDAMFYDNAFTAKNSVNEYSGLNSIQQKLYQHNLNPEYTFENFVMGSHNRYAYAACVGVAGNIVSGKKTRLYNPLFMHGNVGLGKTHLMHAIGNRVLQHNPDAKILYLSSETFTNELINSIRNNKNEEFRNKYRQVDVLLIDDIQFISNKEGTQEEFFHTFNALNDANKQIVITSDRPPKELPKLEERLRSRFSMGVIADIQPPDFETRMAILRKKAEKENTDVPNEVMEYIAENVTNNVRELDGALLNVITFAQLSNRAITVDNAKMSLQNIISAEQKLPINAEQIMNVVAEYYKLKVEDLKSKRRTKEVVLPRQVAMYLCRELTGLSLPRIGDAFGGRDHSTVLHACEKIVQDMGQDISLKIAVENLKNNLK